MTTKYRIIASFVLMIILLAWISILGYRSAGNFLKAFDEYDRLAYLNVGASDLLIAAYRSSFEVYSYIERANPENIQEAKKSYKDANDRLLQIDQSARRPEHKAIINSISDNLKKYEPIITSVEAKLKEIEDVAAGPLDKASQSMLTAINAMIKQAAGVSNINAVDHFLDALLKINNAGDKTNKFIISHLDKDGKDARAALTEARKILEETGGILTTAEGRNVYASLTQSFNDYLKAFTQIESVVNSFSADLNNLGNIQEQLMQNAESLNKDIDKNMREYGRVTNENNKETQTNLLIMGIIGIVIAIICALYIIVTITKVLTQLSGFAEEISKGNFLAKMTVREKGEIGTTVSAIKKIPEVLEELVSEILFLVNELFKGSFGARLDDKKFNGSYAELVKSINHINEAYLKVLDMMPTPIMTCDKDCKILFLNKSAVQAIGDKTSANCADQFNTKECRTPSCIGLKAFKQGSTLNGETTIYPKGVKLQVLVMAAPLYDYSGTPSGFIEVLTDIDDIREQQATMSHVAIQAAEISDRLAAASEELSAQVEQVSKGAEQQRIRVESTAGAMTEMNATVLEVARSAGQASEQSDSSRKKAEDGAVLVNRVVEAVNNVNKIATNLQNNMEELGQQAESIGGVMNVISDIADQTNLLALNAAIEAARAGEAGRGFAVVADEVRKLAEKTMQATQEVGASIKAVQDSAQTNRTEVANATRSIQEATELANSSGSALAEIVDLAAASSDVVSSIATAAEEQSATSEEISRAIDEINQVIGEISEGMNQSSIAVQELSHMAQELRSVMDQLKK